METQTEKKPKVVIFGSSQEDAYPCVKFLQSKYGQDIQLSVVCDSPGVLGCLYHELVVRKPDFLVVKRLECLGDVLDALCADRALKWNNRKGRLLVMESSQADHIFNEISELLKQLPDEDARSNDLPPLDVGEEVI